MWGRHWGTIVWQTCPKLPTFWDTALPTLSSQQWRNIHLLKWEEMDNTMAFWNEIKRYRDAAGLNPFEELATATVSVLSLPHSNAEVEKLFSQMSVVKMSRKPSSWGSISAPGAQMWSCDHRTVTSVSLTLHTRSQLLSTHSLIKLTFETLEVGME